MFANRGRDPPSGCIFWVARRVHKASKGLFRHLKARGNATIIWVANEPEEFTEMQELFGKSLDGVMTDYPSTLTKWAEMKRKTYIN